MLSKGAVMSGYKIRNWDKWQSYRKDRGAPPWIKVHKVLLGNSEWAQLTDSEKGQLVSMWIVASNKDGELPGNPSLLKKICLLDDEPNIVRFLDLGFLEKNGCRNDANATPERRQDVIPEKNRIEKKREEKNTSAKQVCVADTEIIPFELFWCRYPNKKSKAAAEKAWGKLKVDEELFAEIRTALEYQKKTPQWKQEGGKYIPHASTWLNGRRWEDEIEDILPDNEQSPENRISLQLKNFGLTGGV